MVHPNIHDLGIKRNESQQKNLLIANAIMGTFIVLLTVCLIINSALGLFFSFTGGFWAMFCNEYYEKSITPTIEQKDEFNERHGIYCQRIQPAEDKKD